jgi:hypothetical protein
MVLGFLLSFSANHAFFSSTRRSLLVSTMDLVGVMDKRG